MGDFRGNRGFGGRDRRPRRGGFGGRDRGRSRGPVKMYDVICDKCKKECQVPFKPSSNKPVLCDECFKEKGGSSRGGSGISKEQLAQLNGKLDKILGILQGSEVIHDEQVLEEPVEPAEEPKEE